MVEEKLYRDLLRYGPLGFPAPYKLPRNNTSFLEDVSEHWKLYAGPLMGQAILDSSAFNKPYDPDFDPFAEENLSGYEEYAPDFLEVRNKFEMDVIKGRIDRSTLARERIEGSNRGQLLPSLVAGLGDPVNYVALPLSRGYSFFRRFFRTGYQTGAVVAATEPFRMRLDPNATTAESATIIGTSVLLGGALGGTFGKRLDPISKSRLRESGGMKGLGEQYDDAFNRTEGDIDFTGNYDYNPLDDAANVTVKYSTKKTRNVTYDPKEDIVYVNEVKLRNDFQEGTHLVGTRKGVRVLPENAFKNVNDYVSFRIKKEMYKKIYPEFRRANFETFADMENTVNMKVLEDLQYETYTPRYIDTDAKVGIGPAKKLNVGVLKYLEYFYSQTTNQGKILRKFKNDAKLVMDYERGFGDMGVPKRSDIAGIKQKNSALLAHLTEHFMPYSKFREELTANFVKMRTNRDAGDKLLGINPKSAVIRASDMYETGKDKIQSLYKEIPAKERLGFKAFGESVTRAVVDPDFANNPNTSQEVRDAADSMRGMFGHFLGEGVKLNMFASQKSFARLMEKKRGVIAQLERLIEVELQPFKKARYQRMLKRNREEFVDMEADLAEFEANPLTLIDFEDPTYFPRFYRLDKIYEKPNEFKELLRVHFTNNPEKITKDGIVTRSTDPAEIEKRVEKTFNRIIDQEASFGDVDNGLGIRTTKKGFRIGSRSLMTRSLDIETKDILEFIETDPVIVTRSYFQRMSKLIELNKAYGDSNMDNFINQQEIYLVKKYLKKEGDNEDIDDVLNAYIDSKDIFLGVFNNSDPSSFSKRSARLLRNFASLAYMGRVTVGAVAEAARPFTVNGFSRTFGLGLKNFITAHQDVYRPALKNLQWVAEATEIAMDAHMQRFIADGSDIGVGKTPLGRAFDNVGNIFQVAQIPFYWANLLTPWTRWWKNFQGIISAHRFIEDSIKVADGTATEFEVTRLASYGIDSKTAKLIASMPYEKLDNLFTANAMAWETRTGGLTARRAFQQAIYADVNRSIVTPTIADQPNMMHGAFRVSKKTAKALNKTGAIGRTLGYKETEFGGKIDATWPSLFFQFMAWGMAASNKLLMSGLAGRDVSFANGTILSITLGYLINSWIYPNFAEQDIFTQMDRAIDRSGLLNVHGDLNFMLETITGGAFDTPLGARPFLGLKPKYGEPDELDALGTVLGAGPEMVAQVISAFSDEMSNDERRKMLRRLVPLNNMIVLGPNVVRPLFDAGYDMTAEMYEELTK